MVLFPLRPTQVARFGGSSYRRLGHNEGPFQRPSWQAGFFWVTWMVQKFWARCFQKDEMDPFIAVASTWICFPSQKASNEISRLMENQRVG